jgi:hypothetical protein
MGKRTYQIHDGLTSPKNLILFIDLLFCKQRAGFLNHCEITSRSLKAARLISPWTRASFENLSLPCLDCHRLDEEEDELRVEVMEINPVAIVKETLCAAWYRTDRGLSIGYRQ